MSKPRTTTMAETQCPGCERKINAATCLEGDHQPKKDDMTLCFGCLIPLWFNEDLSVRKMTDDEWIELPDEARIELKRTMTFFEERRK